MSEYLVWNPGTPYDQESPESYIPPHLTDVWVKNTPEASEPVSFTRPTSHYLIGYLALNVAAAGVLAVQVKGHFNELAAAREACSSDQVMPSPARGFLDEVRSNVAAMEFAVDKYEYDIYRSDMHGVKSVKEIEAIVSKALEPYSISFAIYPVTDDRGRNVTRPESIDLPIDSYKESAEEILKALAETPAKLLRPLEGLEVYMADQVLSNNEPVDGVYASSPDNSRHILAVHMNPEIIKPAFHHELQHALHHMQCGIGDSNSKNDTGGFTEFNPADFKYGKNFKTRVTYAADEYVATEYGASSVNEDIAETGELLMAGFYNQEFLASHKILAKKMNNILARLAKLEPKIWDYAVYRGYTNGNFPGEIARQSLRDDNLDGFAECYGVEGIGGTDIADVFSGSKKNYRYDWETIYEVPDDPESRIIGYDYYYGISTYFIGRDEDDLNEMMRRRAVNAALEHVSTANARMGYEQVPDELPTKVIKTSRLGNFRLTCVKASIDLATLPKIDLLTLLGAK
jgi:hypothetical protein